LSKERSDLFGRGGYVLTLKTKHIEYVYSKIFRIPAPTHPAHGWLLLVVYLLKFVRVNSNYSTLTGSVNTVRLTDEMKIHSRDQKKIDEYKRQLGRVADYEDGTGMICPELTGQELAKLLLLLIYLIEEA